MNHKKKNPPPKKNNNSNVFLGHQHQPSDSNSPGLQQLNKPWKMASPGVRGALQRQGIFGMGKFPQFRRSLGGTFWTKNNIFFCWWLIWLNQSFFWNQHVFCCWLMVYLLCDLPVAKQILSKDSLAKCQVFCFKQRLAKSLEISGCNIGNMLIVHWWLASWWV